MFKTLSKVLERLSTIKLCLDSSSLCNLETKISYTFSHKCLLKEAITHDSLGVTDHNIKNYQRLEHLGDSVIQMVMTEYLFRAHPKAKEGELTLMRSDLVNCVKQGQIAEKLEISRFIEMAPGVTQFNRYDRFVEAIIGAVYVDAGYGGKGFDEAKKVIYKLWGLQERPSFVMNIVIRL